MLYWNENKTKCLLMATWIPGVFISTVTSLFYKLELFHWEDTFYKYVYPTLDFSFIILAFVTYSVILQQYLQSPSFMIDDDSDIPRKKISVASILLTTFSTSDKRGHTEYAIFKKSVILVPFLLITTFLVFTVTPELGKPIF